MPDIPDLKRGQARRPICRGAPADPATPQIGRQITKAAHEGMGVKEVASFGALVEDLVAALDRFKVPEKEKGELSRHIGANEGA